MNATAPRATSGLVAVALRLSHRAERWFLDAYVFAALAVLMVALVALAMRAAPQDAAIAFMLPMLWLFGTTLTWHAPVIQAAP